ncbi:MAG: hypothetical protein HFH38_11210 [Lachnospiraceae bacterium]|jgi:hypothetical protein|nr:hypothetical protein [Lachnospiraceae bacterium]
MIERKDVLSLPYLKKADFSGSYEGLRFRFRKAENGEGGQPALEVAAWEGPYCYDVTPEGKKQRTEVSFSEEGIVQGIAWLNGIWEAEPERWKAAKGAW